MSQAISGSRRARVLDRERQSWELRVHGATFDHIAHVVGFRSKASAFKSYMRAFDRLKKQIQVDAEQERALMLQRLDALILTYMPQAIAGSRDAAEIVLKTDRRRAELLGLDALAKLSHPGADRGPIERQHDIRISLENKNNRLAASLHTTTVVQELDAQGTGRHPVPMERNGGN